MFYCMLLALASQKERKQRLINLHAFLPFYVHVLSWMQDAKSEQNIQALKGMF